MLLSTATGTSTITTLRSGCGTCSGGSLAILLLTPSLLRSLEEGILRGCQTTRFHDIVKQIEIRRRIQMSLPMLVAIIPNLFRFLIHQQRTSALLISAIDLVVTDDIDTEMGWNLATILGILSLNGVRRDPDTDNRNGTRTNRLVSLLLLHTRLNRAENELTFSHHLGYAERISTDVNTIDLNKIGSSHGYPKNRIDRLNIKMKRNIYLIT